MLLLSNRLLAAGRVVTARCRLGHWLSSPLHPSPRVLASSTTAARSHMALLEGEEEEEGEGERVTRKKRKKKVVRQRQQQWVAKERWTGHVFVSDGWTRVEVQHGRLLANGRRINLARFGFPGGLVPFGTDVALLNGDLYLDGARVWSPPYGMPRDRGR